MKSPPPTPSSTPAARKPPLSAAFLQASDRTGSRGFGASRAAGRYQVPRTADRTPLITHSTQHSSHAPSHAPAAAASAGSTVPSSGVGASGIRSSTTGSSSASSFSPSAAAAARASRPSTSSVSSAATYAASRSSVSPAAATTVGSRLAYSTTASRRLGREASAASLSAASTSSLQFPRLPATSASSKILSTAASPSSSSTTAAARARRTAVMGSSPPPATTSTVRPSAAEACSPRTGTAAASATAALPALALTSTSSPAAAGPPLSSYSSPRLPPSPALRAGAAAGLGSSEAASVPLRSPVSAEAPARTQASPETFSSSAGTATTSMASDAVAALALDSGSRSFPIPSSPSPPSASSVSSSSSPTPASSAPSGAGLRSVAPSTPPASQPSQSRNATPPPASLRSSPHSSTETPRQTASMEQLPRAIREARAARSETKASDSPRVSRESSERVTPHRRGLQQQLSAGPGALMQTQSSDAQQRAKPASVELLRLMARARLAASLENWKDVVATMKQVAASQPALNASQRMLVAGAYTHQLNERRASTKQLQARLSALEVLQRRPPTEAQGGEQDVVSSTPVRDSRGSGEHGWAGRPAGFATGLADVGLSMSVSIEGMDADDKEDETKTPGERLAENQAKASAFLGEAILGSESLVQYAAFFEYMTVHYCQRVAESMLAVLNDMEAFLTSVLLPAAESLTASAAYEQLRGDSLRHVAQEFRDLKKYSHCLEPLVMQRNDQVRQMVEKRSKIAYEAALRHAEEAIPTKVSSVRLGIINNYAVLLQETEEVQGAAHAVDMLGNEFQQTVRQMYEVKDEEEYQRIISVLGLIRDNVEAWCRLEGVNRTAAEALGLQDSGSFSHHVSLSLDSDRLTSIISKGP